MKSLFDDNSFQEIKSRLGKLTPGTAAHWGKMSVSQMISHLGEAIKVPLNDQPAKRIFLGRLLGWTLKAKLHNDTPWKRNLPTAPDFIIKTEKDFIEERFKLLTQMEEFHQKNANGIGDKVHPFFGKLTAEQWGKSTYKHFDHHLKQFGV